MEITLPYNFKPRVYQIPMMRALDSGVKRIFALHHRRSGKDITLWNMIIKKAVEEVGLYFYLLPTYVQAKRIIWDGITNDGKRFIDFIPEELIENKNGTELKIILINGSIIQLIGTDHYDAIRGTNPRGCVFSEYAFQNPMAWEVVKPILKVNGGWACFNTTPNGKNHSWELNMIAKENSNWFTETLTIEDTGVLNEEDMEEERREGMSLEMIQQEYYCSYDVGTLGAYYASLINQCREEHRICQLPIEPNVKVDLFLDLGRNDSTTIIFLQQVGKELRIIDAFEDNGEGVDHYIKILNDKGYDYGHMFLPHDAFNKRMESVKTIAEQFKEGGFEIKRVPKLEINSGIQQVRKIFPRLWFNKRNTEQLVRALESYHKDWDDVAKVFRSTPKHDWSSHYADSVRYLATGLKETDNTVDTYDKAVFKFTNPQKYNHDLGIKADEMREYRENLYRYIDK